MTSKPNPSEPFPEPFDPRSRQPWINPIVLGDPDKFGTHLEEVLFHLETNPAMDRLSYIEEEVSRRALNPVEADESLTRYPLGKQELNSVVSDIYHTFRTRFKLTLPNVQIQYSRSTTIEVDYGNKKIVWPDSCGLDAVSTLAYYFGLIHHWEEGAIYRELKAAPQKSKEHKTLREQSINLVSGWPSFCSWLYANHRDSTIRKELHTLYVRKLLHSEGQEPALLGFEKYLSISDTHGISKALESGLTLLSDKEFKELA